MTTAPSPAGWRTTGAVLHLVLSLLLGVVSGTVAAFFLGAQTATLLASVVTAAVFLVSTWATVWPLDAAGTASMAAREDPGRTLRDLAMLLISVGALVTVVVVIFRVHENP